jgi:hypothetical protein
VYVSKCVPAPAAEGEKEFPLTPFPEYTPPEGFPPESVKGAELIQIGGNELNVTTGDEFTETVLVEVFTHPFTSVPVTV